MSDELFPTLPRSVLPIHSAQQRLSPKQRAVVRYLEGHDTLTLTEAVRLIGGDIYANASKHVGALLANMVRRGMIVRVKAGVFRLAKINPPQVAS